MYKAFEDDLRFIIHHVIGLKQVTHLAKFSDISSDLVDAVLSEAARIARDVIAPLNRVGDTTRSRRNADGNVNTPTGFKAAYHILAKGGWIGLEADAAYGGQGMPLLLSTAVNEMFHSANLGFSLCQLLTQGQIHALSRLALQQQKDFFLPSLVAGRWSATMTLTEPQAGSDLSALRTVAYKADGFYRLRGQKIFITYGDHDMVENIIHLVLARIEGAPAGIKGISVFLVPKFLINTDGTLGARNDVHCISLERKLGIHGSPTAVLQFGAHDGAVGYLVGKAHQGLSIMFEMMNYARFAVGIQGLAISARAFSQAREYARSRVQGTVIGGLEGDTIIHHPDVLRLLAVMRAEIEAGRTLGLYGAMAQDRAQHQCDTGGAFWRQRSALLIPIIKGWLTERAVCLTSDALQVHGGVGYIEQTGAAQHYRDARILPIYEGTTAIQANDLLYRKTLPDDGKAIYKLLAEIDSDANDQFLADNLLACRLSETVVQARKAVDYLIDQADNRREISSVSVPYLMMMGAICSAWMALQSARAAKKADARANFSMNFLQARKEYADITATHSLPLALSYARIVKSGGVAITALNANLL